MNTLFHCPKKSAVDAIGQKKAKGTIHIVATTTFLSRSRRTSFARPAAKQLALSSSTVAACVEIKFYGAFMLDGVAILVPQVPLDGASTAASSP